jgi:hypothetical protein
MSRKTKELTKQQRESIEEDSRLAGESIEEFLDRMKESALILGQHAERLALMRKARGIWKDRQDFSNLADLRSEWDRFSDSH